MREATKVIQRGTADLGFWVDEAGGKMIPPRLARERGNLWIGPHDTNHGENGWRFPSEHGFPGCGACLMRKSGASAALGPGAQETQAAKAMIFKKSMLVDATRR